MTASDTHGSGIISGTEALARLGQPGTVFVDTRPEPLWREATVPGAVSLNVYDYFIPESTETGIAGMVAGARAAFAALGIDTATEVIFFEDRTGMISPRGLWFHELCGLTGGKVLDGGWQAWCAAGGAAAPGNGTPARITDGDPALAGDFRRDLVASTQEVLDRADGMRVLDARRPAEWAGDYVHACCARAGRIDGAALLYFEDLLEDGRYKSPQEILRIAKDAGFDPQDRIVAYCHRGARAATAIYGLRLAGFANTSVYAGSWHEWAADLDLPAIEGSGAYVHR